MKQKVKMSTYCLVISCLSIVLIGGVALSLVNENSIWKVTVLLVLVVLIFGFSLYYSPLEISADSHELTIHRSVRNKQIPMTEIADAQLVQPTASEKRICASGGWFGYWGWMSEPSIGKYFAYYGKASDCFLVRLKDGKQYLLGCVNPSGMVDYIKKQISRNS